jgi:hypothetical protein
MTDRLAIYGLLAGCLCLAALIFWELRPGSAQDAPVVAARLRAAADVVRPEPRPPAAQLDQLVSVILARPLFSATRRPPPSAADGELAGGELTNARLTGIVTEPGHRIALFALPGPKTVVIGKGGVVGGWHIERITPQDVALNGPGGTATLRPRIDPARPIPAAPSGASTNAAALAQRPHFTPGRVIPPARVRARAQPGQR